MTKLKNKKKKSRCLNYCAPLLLVVFFSIKLEFKRLDRQRIKNSEEARKPKGLNRKNQLWLSMW
jgi:hypothetical protein